MKLKTTLFKNLCLSIACFSFFSAFQLNAQSITGFSLVDATTNEVVQDLTYYSIINPSQFSGINIIANTTGNVGSVVFSVDGQESRTESTAPYALAGDNNGDYYSWDIGDSPNPFISAELYSGPGGSGTLISTRTVILNIVDDPDNIFLTDIAINNCPTTSLEVGDVINLDLTLFPANATNSSPHFSGTDFVTEDGVFTAYAPGEYEIRVFDAGGTSDTCTITVNEPPSVAFNNCPTTTIEVGETVSLDVTFPDNILNTYVAYYSSLVGETALYLPNGEFTADAPGEYIVFARTFGTAGDDSCTITVVEATPSPEITGFTLVDADTGDYLDEIGSNAFINPFQSTNLNIVANTTENVGSVVFYIDGHEVRTESTAPYALAGDNAGDFHTWNTTHFTYDRSIDDGLSITLTGELYSEAGGNGTLLSTKSATINMASNINGRDYVYPYGINFDCPTTSIEVGETIDIGVTLLPANTTDTFLSVPTVNGASVSYSGNAITFTAQAPGVYEVNGTSYANGNLFETCLITVVDSSPNSAVNASKQSSDFAPEIYSNLAVDAVTVKFTTNDKYNVTLFNLSGVKVLEHSSLDNYTSLDLSAFKSGIYIIEIEQNGQIKREKILKK